MPEPKSFTIRKPNERPSENVWPRIMAEIAKMFGVSTQRKEDSTAYKDRRSAEEMGVSTESDIPKSDVSVMEGEASMAPKEGNETAAMTHPKLKQLMARLSGKKEDEEDEM